MACADSVQAGANHPASSISLSATSLTEAKGNKFEEADKRVKHPVKI